MDEQEYLAQIVAANEAANAVARVPDRAGPYPSCKPKLFEVHLCQRCGGPRKDNEGKPCPAVPPENRWREL